MEEHDEAVAAPVGGDDGRAVGERGPGLAAEVAVGLGKDLPAHAEIGRQVETEERALAREGREGARRVPGQGAAEIAAAAAQAHRHEIVVAGSEARAGEAQQQPAALDEGRHAGEGLAVEGADIGEGQHGDLLVEQLRDGFGDAAAAVADLRVGGQGAGQVIGRRQEGLRLVGGAAEDEADAAALAALVEERHGAGRAFAEDLDAGDGVADLDGQLEARLGLGRARIEGEARIGERQVLEIEGAQHARVAPVRLGAHHARRSDGRPRSRPRRAPAPAPARS